MDRDIKGASLEVDARALQRVLTSLIRVNRFRDSQAICCYDISTAQCCALDYLVESSGATLNEFAKALFLEKSSASRMIQDMERKGYLRRDPHPDDGRSLQLRLTAEGKALAQVLGDDILAERKRILDGFDPEERKTIILAVGKLADQAIKCCDTSDPDQAGRGC